MVVWFGADSEAIKQMSAFPPKQPPLEKVVLRPLPERPLVSIIVPSFNQGRFIRETIDSILEQDYRPVQIHVIDGASSDETVSVLKSYGEIPELDWVSEPDSGVVEAVNKGFARAIGHILAIQSSDDVYLPGAISRMVEELQVKPGFGLIYADLETIDAVGNSLYSSDISPFSLRGFLSKETWIPQPTAFFRRELTDTCGGWSNEYFNADTQLWLRLVFRTEVRKINTTIAKRRLHDAQRNIQKDKIIHSYAKMIRNSTDLKYSGQSLQRAGRAGIHMHAIKYGASNKSITKTYHLWMAVLLQPTLMPVAIKSPFFIPGFIRIKNGLYKMGVFTRNLFGRASL